MGYTIDLMPRGHIITFLEDIDFLFDSVSIVSSTAIEGLFLRLSPSFTNPTVASYEPDKIKKI